MSLSRVLEDREDTNCVFSEKSLYTRIDETLFDEREGIADMLGRDFTIDDILLEKCQSISESPSCGLCDDF